MRQRARQDEQERNKRIFININRGFIYYDGGLTILNLILTLVFVKHRCVALMFLYYSLFYLAQTCQHYMIFKFPSIDINKHYLLYRRVIILICFIDASYLFSCVIFWQRTQMHPIYCGLHQYFGIGVWVGILLIFHFIFTFAWAISLIQSYINRRYYLLALGGFQVEQRIMEERNVANQNMLMLEVNLNEYPLPQKNKDKYFKFEDVVEIDLEKNQCSICYSRDLECKYVDAGCGHFYHETCLTSWAKLNSTCPQCRYSFPEDKQDQNPKLQTITEDLDEDS